MDYQSFLRRSFAASLVMAVIAASGPACVGAIGGDDGTDAGPQVVTGRFPRLSNLQWELTVVDLFGLETETGYASTFSPDPLAGKAFDDNQTALSVPPPLWRDYQFAAEGIAERVTNDRTLLERVAPRHTRAMVAEDARAFIETFGPRAYRRPITADEIDAMMGLFAKGATLYPELDPFVAGVRVSIAAFLQSPFFLYRPELTEERAEALTPLNDWEIASRLSYAMWNSMPDDELFRAARAGELATREGIHAQVMRMLDSPRTVAVVSNFFDQLYQGRQYESISKNAVDYPDFDPTIASEMRTELGKFTVNVYAEGGGLRELLTSTTDFVTPRLAALYSIPGSDLGVVGEGEFTRVELDPSQRSGLLTLSGFLAWKGREAKEPNSIQRGVFVLKRIACQPLGDPPPAAAGATLGVDAAMTNREKVSSLTNGCGEGCHAPYINPAGFALERYDSMGIYRTEDDGHPVDSSGSLTLDGVEVSYGDAVEFSHALAESPQAHACFSSYLLQYLTGRDPAELAEYPLHEPLADALAGELARHSMENRASARDLFVEVLESDVMRYPLTVPEDQ